MKTITAAAVATALLIATAPTFAATSCETLKTDIAAKVDAKGVKGYTLEIVAKGDVADGKVVGGCDGGTKKIVYKRA
jgi:hypothetical protein